MNPLAAELNETIEREAPHAFETLSRLGKELFFPRGIMTQTAEAKQKATRYNATIGIAKEQRQAMHLDSVTRYLCDLAPDEALAYAPSYGKPELRRKWREEIVGKNPSLRGVSMSLPVVTAGITHGLSLVADLFVDQGDVVFTPDKLWGNYNLVYGVRRGAKLMRYPLLSDAGTFDSEGFQRAIMAEAGRGKLVVLFNFPNNPTGYTVTDAEADDIRGTLAAAAESGCNVVAVCDDAYFGLLYEPELMRESLASKLADSHPRITVVKLDGATKEDFVWGLRVGFITYLIPGGDGAYEALEKKTGGCIRGTISNAPHVSQSIVLKAMADPEYAAQKEEKIGILARRAGKLKEVLADPRFAEAWTPYPFNSGYFMCIRLNGLDAETYRLRLLDKYCVGVISTSDRDIRVALSCVEEDDIPDLFEIMYQCASEMIRQ